MIEYLAFIISALFCYILTIWLIPHLKTSKITGVDMNKEKMPIVAEMGGIAIIAAFIIVVMGVVFVNTIGIWVPVNSIDSGLLMTGTLTVLIAALIGVVDDLISLRQWQKAIIPVVASIPLIAINAGVSLMWVPFIGIIDFGILFYIIIIPLIVTGASNATNMLAGFNGLEAGLGLVSLIGLSSVCFYEQNYEAAIIGLSMSGALFGFLLKNKYPASIFPGDIGTLSIGATIATVTVIGNVHKIGIFVMCLFILELILKSIGKFKSQSWCRFENGFLVCSDYKKIHGVCRLIMYFTGGVSEKNLTLIIIFLQSVFVLFGIFIFYYL